MKKFLKLGLCFLNLVPISLAVYSCSTNTRVEDDYYYDVSDKSTVKDINYHRFGMEFWDDLLVYDKSIENNSEILKSNIQIDLRMFKYLQRMEAWQAEGFFKNIIDKWAKQFSTVGIDDFKGQVDYHFPDSFQGFYGNCDSDLFYLPFQRKIYFAEGVKIKETLAFNMNNDDTECIFPESVEKIYSQHVFDIYDNPKKYYTNQNFLLTLKKIIFPSNFTLDKINYREYDKNCAIFPFKRGSFTAEAKKDENQNKKIGDDTYYYRKENDKNTTDSLGYYTEREQELINNRLKAEKQMEIKISETFRDNDEALRYVFGQWILDSELELLKNWITYI
ncbi:MAG: hypothetical protein K2N92_02305 [Malacoplasma sp.]|nr:hypothetical protein [Malacoplasma sp.]MDE7112411.1 hypothetical protein [Malacoplasma sp.]